MFLNLECESIKRVNGVKNIASGTNLKIVKFLQGWYSFIEKTAFKMSQRTVGSVRFDFLLDSSQFGTSLYAECLTFIVSCAYKVWMKY